jgi:hypothetical protein
MIRLLRLERFSGTIKKPQRALFSALIGSGVFGHAAASNRGVEPASGTVPDVDPAEQASIASASTPTKNTEKRLYINSIPHKGRPFCRYRGTPSARCSLRLLTLGLSRKPITDRACSVAAERRTNRGRGGTEPGHAERLPAPIRCGFRKEGGQGMSSGYADAQKFR